MASKTRAVMEREIGKRIGENIAIHRRSRGLSQVVLAGLVGRTESWLSQIERGVLRIDRLSVLVELARVLKVEVGDLLGGPPLLKSGNGSGYEGLPALRHALLRPDPVAGILEPDAEDEPRALAALHPDVAHTWQLLHACHYAALAAVLPVLLAELRSATRAFEADDRAVAFRLLAELYQVVSGLMKKLGEADLSWIAAERSLVGAERAGAPLLAAAGAWRLGWTYQTLGRPKDAIEIVMAAAAALESGLGAASPPHLSMWGSLHLNAAIAAAQAGERAAARDLLGEARAAARRLGVDRNDFQTFFGPTNVAIYEVSIPVELGDGGIAVERAGIDTSGVKSLERRAHHLIDMARGYGQWAKDSEAVHTLLEAERLAPEEVHYNVMVREFVRDLLRRERRSIKRDLRGLAQRVGVLA